MIGDWVMYNPNVFIEDEYEPAKESYPIQITSGEDIDLAIEDCYSSIPITKEILEKNGFVEEHTYTAPQSLLYSGLADTDNLWIEVSDDGYFEGEIKFVHQLQHALRLCGVNREVEI